MSEPTTAPEIATSKTVEIMGSERIMFGYESDEFFRNIESHVANNPGLIDEVCGLDGGAVFVDVGANIGSTCLLASAIGARIIAIEASPKNADLLERTMTANGLQVELFRCAAGEAPGELRFNESDYGAGSHVDIDGSILVPVRTIDSIVEELNLDRIDLIKIDVEGYELEVLKGAINTLRRFAPMVVMEFNAFAISMHTDASPRLLADYVLEIAGSFRADSADGFLVKDTASLGVFMYQHMVHGSVNDLLWRPFST